METINVVTPGIEPWVLVALSFAGGVFLIGLILHYSKWKDSDNKARRALGKANGILIGWSIAALVGFTFAGKGAIEEDLQDAKIAALEDSGYTEIVVTGDNSFVASDDGQYVIIDILDRDGDTYRVVVETPN